VLHHNDPWCCIKSHHRSPVFSAAKSNPLRLRQSYWKQEFFRPASGNQFFFQIATPMNDATRFYILYLEIPYWKCFKQTDLLSGEKQLLTLLMLEVDLSPLRDLVVDLQETAKRQQRGASSTPMDIVDVIAIFSTKTHQCHHILWYDMKSYCVIISSCCHTHDVVSYNVVSDHIIPCHIISLRMTAHHIMSWWLCKSSVVDPFEEPRI